MLSRSLVWSPCAKERAGGHTSEQASERAYTRGLWALSSAMLAARSSLFRVAAGLVRRRRSCTNSSNLIRATYELRSVLASHPSGRRAPVEWAAHAAAGAHGERRGGRASCGISKLHWHCTAVRSARSSICCCWCGCCALAAEANLRMAGGSGETGQQSDSRMPRMQGSRRTSGAASSVRLPATLLPLSVGSCWSFGMLLSAPLAAPS